MRHPKLFLPFLLAAVLSLPWPLNSQQTSQQVPQPPAAQPSQSQPGPAQPPSVPAPVLKPVKGADGQPYTSDHGQRLWEHMQNDFLTSQHLADETAQKQRNLQQDFTATDEQLRAWEDAVRKANGWPSDAAYDAAKDEWTQPAVQPSAVTPQPSAAPVAKKQ